ncbi:MAG: polyprenyl synthetase family protein, partial [Butyrivibrio sp.]|nr:polyprenyl synthetase family protein [Butyrivibrio sp.]
MGDKDFESLLKTKVEYIEDVIRKMLPAEEGYARTVIEAMNYSLMAGGKRLRPLMMHLTSAMLGSDPDKDADVKYFAATLEMLHTYSLIHDDLPGL